MIILDTNVVSELVRPHPAPAVLKWAQSQSASSFCTTTITKAKIYYGIHLLPQGKRRTALAAAADRILSVNLGGLVIAFNSDSAERYAMVASARRRAEQSLSEPDCQIAAIALVHRASIATRNSDDFDGGGIKSINPWQTK